MYCIWSNRTILFHYVTILLKTVYIHKNRIIIPVVSQMLQLASKIVRDIFVTELPTSKVWFSLL